ncbi:MAG: patatin-like phospholipase family protein [Gammaproteobacteria bacterium]|nr:patatin-like phospholipase family protein [Gammaproteobacteria bacterium]
MSQSSKLRKAVNLALQGGGSHGAFTWGVLDCLLQDDRVDIEGISGTSAGAINAVVLVDGFMQGGIDGARQALHDFWKAVSDEARASPIQRSPLNMLTGDWSLDNSPGYLWFDLVSRMASPYEMNPLNMNPLRDLLERQVDFERIHHCELIKLFVSATNVHTGRVRVFSCGEISVDAVLASACLPHMLQAVEIDGVPYWDGGYMGNPVLFPFFDACETEDVVIVQINPIERKDTPKTARDIIDRVNEITFNSSLLKEFRAIDFVSRLIEDGKLDPAHYKQIRVHRIEGNEFLNPLGASSKLNTEWAFLQHLFEAGRDTANVWIEGTFDALGKHSSMDLRAMFQG